MMLFSALGYIGGSLAVAIASFMPLSGITYWLIYIGFLLTGLGWGAVEAASNPMITAVYPDEKTRRLNILHAWWPAGVVVGGLAGLAFSAPRLTVASKFIDADSARITAGVSHTLYDFSGVRKGAVGGFLR